MMKIHNHRLVLTGASGYDLPPGELKIYRRCDCGETRETVMKAAGGMTKEDIPVVVKTNCFMHIWRNVRDYTYFIHTDLGKIQASAKLKKCQRCFNIKIQS